MTKQNAVGIFGVTVGCMGSEMNPADKHCMMCTLTKWVYQFFVWPCFWQCKNESLLIQQHYMENEISSHIQRWSWTTRNHIVQCFWHPPAKIYAVLQSMILILCIYQSGNYILVYITRNLKKYRNWSEYSCVGFQRGLEESRFRKSYGRLAELRSLSSCQILLLTATITEITCKAIQKSMDFASKELHYMIHLVFHLCVPNDSPLSWSLHWGGEACVIQTDCYVS